MWHIMLCGLLALSAFSELDPREKSEKALLTEQKCESCPTCAKCAKNNATERSTDASNADEEAKRDWCAIERARRARGTRRLRWGHAHTAPGRSR